MKRLLSFLFLSIAMFVVAATLCIPGPLAAQTPAAPAAGDSTMSVDPIRCWWRTTAGAIRTGETFDLTLTCAVVDTTEVQVVPDQSRLEPAVAQFAPFEVVSGTHPADLHSGARRFFQYQYVLRIINADAIGKDTPLAETTIHYRINSRMAANASLQGRDLVYVLPHQTIRVASMVPADAPDIRDTAGEDFALVDTLQFRARLLEIVALTCIALGVLMTLLVIARAFRRAGKRTPSDERQLSVGQMAGVAARTLNDVQRQREQGGWNDVLVGQALAATRISGACAADLAVNQRIADPAASDSAGRLIVPGPFRGKPRALSSGVTADELSRVMARKSAPATQQSLDGLRRSLAAFSKQRYGRNAVLDQAELDAALASAVEATAAVRRNHSWLKDTFRAWRAGDRALPSRA